MAAGRSLEPTLTLALALIALAVVLAFAIARPEGWPEAVVALPAAGLLITVGAISVDQAVDQVDGLLPVVGFLAAVLLLAHICDNEGLFHAAGTLMTRTSAGSPGKLLTTVFIIAAATTALLSLDATAVLLTPVVLASARTMSIPPRPHAYVTAHLANTASLLFPVSNLTNLLAFTAAGISFIQFTAVMALPFVAALAVEFVILRALFARELRPTDTLVVAPPAPEIPVFVLAVLAATLGGFVVMSLLGHSPAWAALAGAIVLGARSLKNGRSSLTSIVGAVNLPFLVFVLCLGVVVDAVMLHGLDRTMRDVLPEGNSLPALLGLAAVAAVLANAVNNLPAVLVLVPLVASAGPGAILAVLIGVNIGPNLSYVGSLANLLWRDVVHRSGVRAPFYEFSRIGLATVPFTLVAAVLGLWAGMRIFGL